MHTITFTFQLSEEATFLKNIIISICLFISIIVASFVSVSYLNKIYINMKTTNNLIKQQIENNNWEEANKVSVKFSEDWHRFSNNCTVFVNHTLIDDVSIEEHKLEQLISCKNKDEALTSSSSIDFLLDRISKLENINIQNIF